MVHKEKQSLIHNTFRRLAFIERNKFNVYSTLQWLINFKCGNKSNKRDLITVNICIICIYYYWIHAQRAKKNDDGKKFNAWIFMSMCAKMTYMPKNWNLWLRVTWLTLLTTLIDISLLIQHCCLFNHYDFEKEKKIFIQKKLELPLLRDLYWISSLEKIW